MPLSGPRLRRAALTMNEVGTRVKERRRALKLTHDGLCAQLASATPGAWTASRQEVDKIDAGICIVSDVEVLPLARDLSCSPCVLLTARFGPPDDARAAGSNMQHSSAPRKKVSFEGSFPHFRCIIRLAAFVGTRRESVRMSWESCNPRRIRISGGGWMFGPSRGGKANLIGLCNPSRSRNQKSNLCASKGQSAETHL
jgi:hypothetical protein